MNNEKLTINDMETYTIEKIAVFLKCGKIRAKQIRDDIVNKLDLTPSKNIKIKKEFLLGYIKANHNEEFTIREETTKEEILNKIFVDSRDVEVLLGCAYKKASRITNKVHQIMIENGLTPLGNTILTKYLITYLNNENIKY